MLKRAQSIQPAALIRISWFSFIIYLLALGCVIVLPPSTVRLLAALLLTGFLPGWSLVLAFDSKTRLGPAFPDRLLIGAGLSFALTSIVALWLYYAFGRLTMPFLLSLNGAVSLIGFGLALWRTDRTSSSTDQTSQAWHWWLAAILLLSSYFAFYALGYSDFRGDEAEVVLRAVTLQRGVDDPIFTHTKGPTENLVAVTMGELAGSYDEWSIRLPFALASLLMVGASFVVGSALFGPRVGLLLAALMAINGWLVSHSRTAQYQNVLLLLSILAVWHYRCFQQSRYRPHLWLGTIFAAAALLGHYDGAAILPALVYLLWRSLISENELPGTRLRKLLQPGILAPVLIGTTILLTFYVPFFLNPNIDRTQSYLAGFFTGQQLIFNNWDTFYVNGLFYNSIYFVGGLGLILLVGTLRGVAKAVGDGRRGWIVAFIALPFLLLSWTGLLPPWYALAVFLVLMGLFLFSNRIGLEIKVVLLWVLPPLLLYLFIIVRPGNHYYAALPPILLLAALTIDWLLRRVETGAPAIRRIVLPLVAGLLLILYGLSAWYEQLVFLRTDLEYLLTYPAHRNPIFISDPRYPFDIRIGWGFPYRLGWQTISDLYRRGDLNGDWYGNDTNNTIRWYTTGQMRNPCYPRYFMLTEIGYEEPPLAVPQEIIDAHYSHTATVEVNGQPRLRLYEFDPQHELGPPVIYQEPTAATTPYRPEMYASRNPSRNPRPALATSLAPARQFKPHPNMLAELATVYDDPNVTRFEDMVKLEGYEIDSSLAEPGGVVLVTLDWSTDGAVILPYKVFTHLIRDGTVFAQADSEPACGFEPTYTWRRTEVIDRHAVFLPPDLPPGEYTLEIGLYEVRTGLRMDLLDEMGNPAGNALTLPTVMVSPSQ